MMTPEQIDELKARAQFIVLRWNANHKAGTNVTYLKSPLEGKIILKTTGAAYVLGDEAVVELEHIGTAMLKKTEIFSG